ncbi:hypothetical protein BC832DRAFT_559832 [Gaertneriomyces semiglobifer]|nr:hypothetical protein BC832DRAFT_559832 [Gaertneriomyces semiglobifer]
MPSSYAPLSPSAARNNSSKSRRCTIGVVLFVCLVLVILFVASPAGSPSTSSTVVETAPVGKGAANTTPTKEVTRPVTHNDSNSIKPAQPPGEDAKGGTDKTQNDPSSSNSEAGGHHGADDDDDMAGMDHELLHGEPGVADPVGPVFEMDSIKDGSWKPVLEGVNFVVAVDSKPPIFIAQPTDARGHLSTLTSDFSIAVLMRTMSDSIALEETAQVIDVGCDARGPSGGYAHHALLAAVRGAGIVHCVLPTDVSDALLPPIQMAARLNAVSDKLWFHSMALPTTTTKAAGTSRTLGSVSALPIMKDPIALLRISLPGQSSQTIIDLLTSSFPLLASHHVRHVTMDLPSTTEIPKERFEDLLDKMYLNGYDLYFLPGSKTYEHIAVASYLGSEYQAKGLQTEFIYIPKQDYAIVKENLEAGALNGEVQVWWALRQDPKVKEMMATRHHNH